MRAEEATSSRSPCPPIIPRLCSNSSSEWIELILRFSGLVCQLAWPWKFTVETSKLAVSDFASRMLLLLNLGEADSELVMKLLHTGTEIQMRL
jgi:hypothetical protein